MGNTKSAPKLVTSPQPEPIAIPARFEPLVERMRRMAQERDRLAAMLDGDVGMLRELMAAGGEPVPEGYVLRNLDVGFESPPRMEMVPSGDEGG